MTSWFKTWPHGKTWVFQGTVAEDATGGTHVCSLTVTPGTGNELKVLYGEITIGNTATSQTPFVGIDDGTNELTRLLNTDATGITTASLAFPFPEQSGVASTRNEAQTGEFLVSGTMRLRLQVTTAAVSVTQTFAVVCRIKGAVPTATLADTVGTPVLTTNTSRVF